MQAELVIRPGRPGDAQNLAALAIQVFLHTYATAGISTAISRHLLSEFSTEKFEALLDSETVTVFVAELRAHVVAYARLDLGAVCPERNASTAELATLYVQEHFVGQGVGAALLAQARAWALERTGQPLWLTVNAMNRRAIAFYAKQGFTKIGVAQFVLGGESHENHVLVAGGGSATAPIVG